MKNQQTYFERHSVVFKFFYMKNKSFLTSKNWLNKKSAQFLKISLTRFPVKLNKLNFQFKLKFCLPLLLYKERKYLILPYHPKLPLLLSNAAEFGVVGDNHSRFVQGRIRRCENLAKHSAIFTLSRRWLTRANAIRFCSSMGDLTDEKSSSMFACLSFHHDNPLQEASRRLLYEIS